MIKIIYLITIIKIMLMALTFNAYPINKTKSFQLKKLPAQSESDNDFKNLRIVNSRNDLPKYKDEEIGLRVGIVYPISGLNNASSINYPYTSIFYRPSFLKLSGYFFGELELAYFRMEESSSYSYAITTETHTIMPILSIGFNLPISSWYKITAKLGVGMSFQLVDRSITGVASTLQAFDNEKVNILAVGKFALHNEFKISDRFNLSIGADLYTPVDTESLILLLSPNIGLSYKFERDVSGDNPSESEIGFYVGTIIPLDKINSDVNFNYIYSGVYYKPSWLDFNLIQWEMDLAYFLMETKSNSYLQKNIHSIFTTISISKAFKLAKSYHLVFKTGGGAIYQLATTNNTSTLSRTLHQFGEGKSAVNWLVRAGFRNEIAISRLFDFIVNLDVFWQLPANGVITYFAPSIGLKF